LGAVASGGAAGVLVTAGPDECRAVRAWGGRVRSSTWFQQNVARIRPDYASTDPADRIVYAL